MNRLPRPSVLAALTALATIPTAEPTPTICPLVLPPPFCDNPKIRAADAKRARRAAKWRKEGRE